MKMQANHVNIIIIFKCDDLPLPHIIPESFEFLISQLSRGVDLADNKEKIVDKTEANELNCRGGTFDYREYVLRIVCFIVSVERIHPL